MKTGLDEGPQVRAMISEADETTVLVVSILIFLMYFSALLLVVRRIPLRYFETSAIVYLSAFLLCFVGRLIVAIFALFNPDLKDPNVTNSQKWLLFSLSCVHSLADRVTMTISLHFTLEMREVQIKLACNEPIKFAASIRRHRMQNFLLTLIFILLQVPIVLNILMGY